jgi:hypothetical protein
MALKGRYGLQLHVETVPMGIVRLHLDFFCSEQVPRNGTLKKLSLLLWESLKRRYLRF